MCNSARTSIGSPRRCRCSAFAKFPFTTKKDLRDHYPFGMFAVPREEVVRIHASSGTTGKPTVVGYTQNDFGLASTEAVVLFAIVASVSSIAVVLLRRRETTA